MAMKSVLVVEDDESMLEFCATLLALDGYQVTAVPSGKLALQQLDTARFDLVLSDHIRVDMEGTSLAEAVKVRYPSIKVIVMSGLPSLQDAVTCYLAGASDYLAKPFSLDDFRSSVRRCLA